MNDRARMRFTEAEYLGLSAASERKFEFIDGEIILFGSGGAVGERRSLAHNLITVNIAAGLHARLRGRPCKVFSSDQRLCVDDSGAYVYPDVTVVCPPFATREGSPTTFIAPRLVVEVLSSGTEGHDRNRKWPLYQAIESLCDVLLVEQATRRVQHHRRVGPNEWLVRWVTDGEVAIESLEVALSIDEIYSGVEGLPG